MNMMLDGMAAPRRIAKTALMTRRGRIGVEIGDKQASPWPAYSRHFPKSGGGIGKMAQNKPAPNQIEHLIPERQGAYICRRGFSRRAHRQHLRAGINAEGEIHVSPAQSSPYTASRIKQAPAFCWRRQTGGEFLV